MNLLKKFVYVFTFNLTLFFILMIGIQNSNDKNKVNFIFNESIELPNSFILGLSFIFGSVSGSILCSSYSYRNK
tara:strand:+ start:349 stop:570 length:222 start_codon:yes stop_codon:yes gene_type:complete